MFKKIESENKNNFYSSSITEIFINESDINDAFQSIYGNKQSMITIYNNNYNKHTKILRKNIQFTINNVLKKNMLTYY